MVAVTLAVIVYAVAGYTVFPALLAPFGCTGAAGDLAVGHAPNTSFDIGYDADNASLSVRHAGGATLTAERTERLQVSITVQESQRSVAWAEAGGRFPVQRGSTVRISDTRIENGSAVRVEWRGSWPDPQPNYCPNNHPTATSVTLAKRVF
jgi:hypothetical protein